MVVVGVLVADADDAESLRIYRPSAVVRSSLELCFDLYVNVRAVEVIYNVMNLLSLQANGVATPFAELLRYRRISVLFESAHEVTVILVDQCKPAVLEIR